MKEVPDTDYGGTNHVGISGNFYFGEKTSSLLDSEGMSMVITSWDCYISNWRYDEIHTFADKTCSALLGYKNYTGLIVGIVITIILLTLIILRVVFFTKHKIKKT